MIRLIASDLDGTLLNARGELPTGVFDSIRRLREKGVLFAAASGRQLGNLERLFFPVRREMAFIAENGAYIAAGDMRRASTLPRPVAEGILRDLLQAGMEVLISAPQTSYVLASGGKAFSDDILYRLRNTVTVIDDPFPLADGFIKLSGFRWKGISEEEAAPFQQKWQKTLNVALAGDQWLDFTLASKGTALKALSEALEIPLRDMAAFGDQYNDLSMLEIVGHPFLMETAPAGLHTRGFSLCGDVLTEIDRILASQ